MKPFTILGRRASFPWTDRLVEKLSNREYRDAFVAEGVKSWVARQIRALREQRKLSQSELGELCSKPQNAISRLEDPDYGQMSLQTLLELASAFDVALSVKFVDYPAFLRETKDTSTQSMLVDSFTVSNFSAETANSIIIQSQNTFVSFESEDSLIGSTAANDVAWMAPAISNNMRAA
jgi:transcriptional regulator with XRE-family HTH domain